MIADKCFTKIGQGILRSNKKMFLKCNKTRPIGTILFFLLSNKSERLEKIQNFVK